MVNLKILLDFLYHSSNHVEQVNVILELINVHYYLKNAKETTQLWVLPGRDLKLIWYLCVM